MNRILKYWTGLSLVWRIFIGLVIGVLLGLFCPSLTAIGILGKIFVSALKAIAPVLVAVLVAASIAKAGGGMGPRFRTVILLYMLTTFLAAVIAVVGSFLFPVTVNLKEAVAGEAPGALSDVFTNLLTNMVSNPLLSVSSANYIGILFWAIVVGLALKLKAG
ncbi:MAG: cation:dicarboxylase symporter family transporter, partial [Bacteroidaceae bacterium]|nr:cation:dicarboxylase symporter family transporter [Bacteroidaceae bacterium]